VLIWPRSIVFDHGAVQACDIDHRTKPGPAPVPRSIDTTVRNRAAARAGMNPGR